MSYKKKQTCGREHPSRPGVKCWGKGCEVSDQHWSMISVRGQLVKVTWRINE